MTAPHVVIVGNGMAGARLAEDLRRRDPHHMLAITILGDEVHEAYNRVLLSEVLAGRHVLDDIRLGAPGWHETHGVDVRLGDAVVGIDRAHQVVRTAAGREMHYDVLVFATGSEPNIPNIEGLCRDDETLIPNAFFLRTVDDCRELLVASRSAHRVAVIGGGLLGIEAARALAVHDTEVIVLHGSEHLLDRQLDAAAGDVLGRALHGLAIAVRLGATAKRVIIDDAGRLGGVELADGSYVLADLLVIAAGTAPRVELARACGLRVDRGIVIDATMRSVDDPRIFAIGDCAQFSDRVYGVAAAAWEHAAMAANHITGSDPAARYTGSRSITRLKAEGLTVASMGNTEPVDELDEIVMVTDTAKGSYRKLVVRDGKLQGAVVVGELASIATICQLYQRDAVLPSDRLSLLAQSSAGSSATSGTTPALMPLGTTVCTCNGVTKKVIQNAVLGGARTLNAVASETRATTGCGGCTDVVCGLVDWLVRADTGADEAAMQMPATVHEPPIRRELRTPVEAS